MQHTGPLRRQALPLEDELPLQLLQAAPEVAAAKAATKGALEEAAHVL